MLIFKVSVAINLANIYSIVIKDGLRLFNTMSHLLDLMIQNIYFFLFVFNSSTALQLVRIYCLPKFQEKYLDENRLDHEDDLIKEMEKEEVENYKEKHKNWESKK